MKRSIGEDKAPETVLLTVARGKSIQVGDRLYLAGELAPVPAEDVAHVRAGGFVHDPDGPPVVRSVSKTAGDNPANIGLQHSIEP
jgi:hypothetical protein